MANEISFSASLSYSKSGANATISASISVTQVGADFTNQSQLIGTASAELLDVGSDVGTTGYVMVKNNDPTNFVELSLNDFTQKFAKLRAGEFCILPVSTGTIYAKADTGACQVSVLAIEL
jgi:hypothetical protein